MIRLKRAYEPAEATDGARVLVDRLWPRGVSREDAALERWMKEVAPSHELRRWYGHDPERWEAFRERYREELEEHQELVAELQEMARAGDLTLVFAARDVDHSNAAVLGAVLEEKLAE